MEINIRSYSMANNEIRRKIVLQYLHELAAVLVLIIGILSSLEGFGLGYKSTFYSGPNANGLLKASMSSLTKSPLLNQPENHETDLGQTITFNLLAPATYGDPVIILSATASSGLPVTFESDNSSVATVSGNSLTIVGAGTANITASQSGDGTFDPAPDVVQVLVINKATLSAMADNKTKVYGDPNPPLTLTYTGFKGSDNASVIDSPPALATEVTQFSPVDSYSISVISEGIDNNYDITPHSDGTITITKAALTAIADDKVKTYGNPNPEFTITYSGFKGLDNDSSIDTPPSLATDATQFSPVDLYNISFISEAIDNNYDISSFTDGVLTINKADQSIDFEEIGDKTILDLPFTLIATSASGLQINFASSNSAVISINGTIATIHSSGSTTITASQVGDVNFNAADDVTQNVVVNGNLIQSITFEAIPDKTLGDPSFTISAISSSNLNVTFAAQTSNIALDGDRVTLLNAGRATIRAAQPGNGAYQAAEPVSQSFCVNPAKPLITLPNASTETPTLTSSATSGNQWFLNGNPISGATSVTFNPTEFGSYTVRSTVEGCASEISSERVVVILGDVKEYTNSSGVLYPVPAEKQIFLSLITFSQSEDVRINIHDVSGKVLYQDMARGGTVVGIDIAQFSNGLYLLRAKQGQNSIVCRFIKE